VVDRQAQWPRFCEQLHEPPKVAAPSAFEFALKFGNVWIGCGHRTHDLVDRRHATKHVAGGIGDQLESAPLGGLGRY